MKLWKSTEGTIKTKREWNKVSPMSTLVQVKRGDSVKVINHNCHVRFGFVAKIIGIADDGKNVAIEIMRNGKESFAVLPISSVEAI